MSGAEDPEGGPDVRRGVGGDDDATGDADPHEDVGVPRAGDTPQEDPLRIRPEDLPEELRAPASARSAATLASRTALALGAVLHLMVGALVVGTALIAPLWATLLLGVLWLAVAWLAWRWRTRPLLVLLLPLATVGVLWAVTAAGGAWLGWAA